MCRATRRGRPWALAALLALAGCAWLGRGPALDEPVDRIAVLPIERDERASDLPVMQDGRLPLAPDAEAVVTAQIYAVLSSSPRWNFVPDLTVTQALDQVPKTAPLLERAVALGRAVNADAVLCGTVWRFAERVGSAYGARQPAAVSFELLLVSAATGRVLWRGTFDQQQEALTTNLLNWWQFWAGGPRWFTASEFTRLGVERLLTQLTARMR